MLAGVVPLGFDAHREDPIAVLGLYSEDFGRVGSGLPAWARRGSTCWKAGTR